MSGLKNSFDFAVNREEQARTSLAEVVHCVGSAREPGNFRTIHPVSWLQRADEHRQQYRDCIVEFASLRESATRAIAEGVEELEKLRTKRPPLPGSAEFDKLAAAVREAEAPRVQAQGILEELDGRFSPAETSRFLDRVNTGIEVATGWLIKIAAARARETCERQARDLAQLASTGVLQTLSDYDSLQSVAARVNGKVLPAPRIEFPALQACRLISEATPPRIQEA